VLTGRVISFTGKFGFIDADGEHIYFRANDCRCAPYRGDTVRYDLADGGGKPKAVNVRAVRSAVVSEVDRVFGRA
jgi:cold shock CspA family protein